MTHINDISYLSSCTILMTLTVDQWLSIMCSCHRWRDVIRKWVRDTPRDNLVRRDFITLMYWYTNYMLNGARSYRFNIPSHLVRYCMNGYIGCVRWTAKTFIPVGRFPSFTIIRLFLWSCEYGRLETAMWVAKEYSMTPRNVKAIKYRHSQISHPLGLACANDHLEVAQWLTTTFNLTAEDARYDESWALVGACTNGYIDVVKWLVETFSFTRRDIKPLFAETCAGGYLVLAKWMVEKFRLTINDVRGDIRHEFQCVRIYGFPEVVKWLVETFSLTIDDVRGNGVLMCVRRNGDLETIEYLKATFPQL